MHSADFVSSRTLIGPSLEQDLSSTVLSRFVKKFVISKKKDNKRYILELATAVSCKEETSTDMAHGEAAFIIKGKIGIISGCPAVPADNSLPDGTDRLARKRAIWEFKKSSPV